MAVSLDALVTAWEAHPLGKRRASGGRHAMAGFAFQFMLGLERFFEKLTQGLTEAPTAFEGLSDLAGFQGDLLCLVQCKRRLDKASMRDSLKEVFALDRFLLECFPDLAQRYRYEIACALAPPKQFLDMATLEPSQLDLDQAEAADWLRLRPRVRVHHAADPELRLAILLFPHVQRVNDFIQLCLGTVWRQVVAGVTADAMATSLSKLLDDHRRQRNSSLKLLNPTSFTDAAGGALIHGRRPKLEDVNQLMARPLRVAAVMAQIRQLMGAHNHAAPSGRDIPVLYLRGPSGCGKSVLMLQVLQQLAIDQEHACVLSASSTQNWRRPLGKPSAGNTLAI